MTEASDCGSLISADQSQTEAAWSRHKNKGHVLEISFLLQASGTEQVCYSSEFYNMLLNIRPFVFPYKPSSDSAVPLLPSSSAEKTFCRRKGQVLKENSGYILYINYYSLNVLHLSLCPLMKVWITRATLLSSHSLSRSRTVSWAS